MAVFVYFTKLRDQVYPSIWRLSDRTGLPPTVSRCVVIALYLCGLAVYYCLNLSSSVLARLSMSLNNCLFLWCCQLIVFLNRQWKEIVRTEQNKETRETVHYLGGIIHSRGKHWEQIHVEIFNIHSVYFIWTVLQEIQVISLKNISLKRYNSVLLDFYFRLSVMLSMSSL